MRSLLRRREVRLALLALVTMPAAVVPIACGSDDNATSPALLDGSVDGTTPVDGAHADAPGTSLQDSSPAPNDAGPSDAAPSDATPGAADATTLSPAFAALANYCKLFAHVFCARQAACGAPDPE